MKRLALVVLSLLVLFSAACGGAIEEHEAKRGRGDAGVSTVNDCDRKVYQAPDQFANVSVIYVYEVPSDDTTGDCSPGTGACNGLYQTTRKEGTLQMHVVPNDPTCPGTAG